MILFSELLFLSNWLSYGLALAGAALMAENIRPGIGELLKKTALTTIRFYVVWYVAAIPLIVPALSLERMNWQFRSFTWPRG